MHNTALPPLTGVVLAGGRSRRMGRDKALLVVDGQPLIMRVARRLEPLCQRVLIAGGARRLELDHEHIPDPVDDAGPLAGIVAGLQASSTPLTAVVAVDMPLVNTSVLAVLARAWSGEPAVVPAVDGHPEPLHGVYARDSAADFRRCLDDGPHRLTDVVAVVGACVVDRSAWSHVDPCGSFATNLNCPQDLARFDLAPRHWMSMGGTAPPDRGRSVRPA